MGWRVPLPVSIRVYALRHLQSNLAESAKPEAQKIELRNCVEVDALMPGWLDFYSDSQAFSASRSRWIVETGLRAADHNWGLLSDMLFQDRFNDGSHVRDWLNAIREGRCH